MSEIIGHSSRQGPAIPEIIDELHADLDSLWAKASFVPEMDQMAFTTAVIEAATNVVQHATPASDAQLQLGVDITIWPRRLQATVSEIGAAASRPDLDGASSPDQDIEAESGRGLALIRALVSTVTFERHGDTNVWTLCKESPQAQR
ncbi:ATP-binding protein [Arthrobacter sp. H14]|uniref:ATP-binding protein n=1 Tax=Arthrobacter sp. H14 TaxID=1312959 RepID=UPI000479DDD3|nr:ATP-binding protein [Arthrobacter sp. H14]